MPEGPDRAPQRVIGRYALYGEIAAGGMATVHAGRLLGPVGFSRTVAIKRLHPQYAKDPEFVSMFLDEARVAARIQHPNVVSTLDVVALEGELFLVMEYVEGESLARILRTMRTQNRQMPPKIAGSIVCNMLYGLHAAHDARSERGDPLGIVHRDVSPQNILVGVDGAARVLDFGVAKAAGRVQTTREGQVKGKLAYMPPEQLAGEKVDRRLDVYAAAVVLWETLTSRRLFDGENEGAVLKQVLTGTITPPSELVPGLPKGVDEILMKGLERNPANRYQTAREMAVDLEDVLGVESPRKVAEFVDSCAGESIAKRAARIKEIESSSTDSSAEPASESSGVSGVNIAVPVAGLPLLPLRPPSPSMTSLDAVTPAAPARSKKNVFLVVGIVGALGLFMLLAVVFSSRGKTSAAGASTSMASASATVAQIPAPPPTPPASAQVVSQASVTPEPSVSAAPKASAKPVVSAKPVARTPSSSCNPPYVIVNGIRKIKPECLN